LRRFFVPQNDKIGLKEKPKKIPNSKIKNGIWDLIFFEILKKLKPF